jgi:hypothetical protein
MKEDKFKFVISTCVAPVVPVQDSNPGWIHSLPLGALVSSYIALEITQHRPIELIIPFVDAQIYIEYLKEINKETHKLVHSIYRSLDRESNPRPLAYMTTPPALREQRR